MEERPWRPQKRWGQSFLHDGNIIRKIVSLADLDGHETVVEIGPGRGALTSVLVSRVGRLVLLEIDPQLVSWLTGEYGQDPRVEIVAGDVLACDFASLATRQRAERLKVVGNIPYRITSPILFHLLAARQVISRAILMVQKEVALRLTSSPGTKTYGIPTVLFAPYGVIERQFDVPPTCFHPPPRVTSSVITVNFSSTSLMPLADEAIFFSLVRQAFHHRRKMLLNNLLSWPERTFTAKELHALWEKLGWGTNLRAESVSPEQFVRLSNELVPLMR